MIPHRRASGSSAGTPAKPGISFLRHFCEGKQFGSNGHGRHLDALSRTANGTRVHLVHAGFYTLSSSNVPLNEVPEPLAKKLPRYPSVPAVLIGWLGRHTDHAGQGLGDALLFDAIKTLATSPIGAHAIFADAIDDKAASFYAAFGFTPLIERPRTLDLPVTTALSLLSA